MNHSTKNSGNFGMKIRCIGHFQKTMFENLDIPHEVVLIVGNNANLHFAISINPLYHLLHPFATFSLSLWFV